VETGALAEKVRRKAPNQRPSAPLQPRLPSAATLRASGDILSFVASATLIEPREVMRDSEWFKAVIGDVQVVYMDSVADSAHARFLTALREDLDAIVPGRRRGILYEVTERVRVSAAQRKQYAELFREKERALRAGTSGYALVTPSRLVRGFLTATFWFAPPPYPYSVEPTLEAGLAFLARHQGSIVPESVLATYEVLKARFVPAPAGVAR
jgi:hypothetical protein